jgi:hypothetical protein
MEQRSCSWQQCHVMLIYALSIALFLSLSIALFLSLSLCLCLDRNRKSRTTATKGNWQPQGRAEEGERGGARGSSRTGYGTPGRSCVPAAHASCCGLLHRLAPPHSPATVPSPPLPCLSRSLLLCYHRSSPALLLLLFARQVFFRL